MGTLACERLNVKRLNNLMESYRELCFNLRISICWFWKTHKYMTRYLRKKQWYSLVSPGKNMGEWTSKGFLAGRFKTCIVLAASHKDSWSIISFKQRTMKWIFHLCALAPIYYYCIGCFQNGILWLMLTQTR